VPLYNNLNLTAKFIVTADESFGVRYKKAYIGKVGFEPMAVL
jgi:hypothetical protein